MCPYLLIGDSYLLPFWVPSENNPADDGSRGKSLRHCSSLAEVVAEDILKTCTTFSMVADAIREAEAAGMRRRREGARAFGGFAPTRRGGRQLEKAFGGFAPTRREASASSGGLRGSSSSVSSP